MAFDLHTRFPSKRSAPTKCIGIESKGDTIYFLNIGAKEKLKKSAIEDKLGLSTFHRLHFFKCDSVKAYKTTFAYLMHNHLQINILEIYSINDTIFQSVQTALIQFILSECCSKLIKLAIHSNNGDHDAFALQDLFAALLNSNSLSQTLQCLQLENMQINSAIKLDKTLSKFIVNANKTLKILDLRNLKFCGRQNYELANVLTNCLWHGSDRKKGAYSCSISEFFFGGGDNWTVKAMYLMCDFIKYNYNLEILGVELLHSPRDNPFISATDGTAIGVFILSMENHPSMQRLELYHMQGYTLKVFGNQFEKRVKYGRMRLTELHIQQVHQNTFANPMDHTVFPSIIRITQKMEWLQLLELKISVFCNLNEVKQLCKLLSNCRHLNGLRFHCKMGEMFSKKQILICVNHIVDTFKEIKKKNIRTGRVEIISAIENNLIIANNGNKNIDKDIAIIVLSYADIAYAFDAGLLFFESTFLNKLDFNDRIPANQWLLNNWKKLPYNGENMNDQRYKNARNKLVKFNKKMQSNRKSQSKKKSKIVGYDDSKDN